MVLLFSAIPLGTITVSAASDSGTCGDNLTWSFDTETGVLDITGSGAMTNYSFSSHAPWYSYRSSVKTVNIGNNVTSIGSYAFSDCPATIYGVFGSEAERYALANGMKFIELPEKIKIFYKPDKLTYTLNSKLDLEGLIVAIYYPSGLLEWRYKGFEISGFDTSAPGTKTVTISYLGATASFDIEVTGVIGDGNGDGKTNAEDLTLLTNALTSGAEYNGNLDINGNGSLDILDIIALKKLLADNPV